MAILTRWTGAAGNGDWADAANWDNGVPLPGDTLTADQQAVATIDNSIATAPFTVTIAGSQSAQDVTLDAANPPGAPAVSLTGTLFLEWNVTPSSGSFGVLDLRQGSFELDGGDIRVGIIRQNGGSLTVGDAATWGASTLDACLVAGPVTLTAGADLVVAQSSFAAFGVDGDTTVTVQSGATLSARGDLGLNGASTLDLAGGTLSLNGGSVTGGTVLLDGGSLAMTAGTTLRDTTLDGDFNILGQSLVIGAATTVTFDKSAGAVPVTVSLDHDAALLVYGTLAIAGTASLDPGAVLWLIDGGVLQSATVEGGIFQLSGNGTLSDTSLDSSITLLTDHGTPVLTITGSTTLGDPTDSVQQTIDLGGGTLEIGGTLALRDAVLTNGTVLVTASGSLDADGMSSLAGVSLVDTALTQWTGAGDGQSWSDPGNWSAGIPVSGHSLDGAHLAVALVNNDVAAPFSLVIDGSQSAQDVTLDAADPGGPAIDLTGTLDLGWGTASTSPGLLDLKQGSFALDGGTLANATVRLDGGSLTTGGDGTAGTLDGVWIQGDLSLDAGGTLVVAGDGLTLETAGSGPVLLQLDGDTTLAIAAGLSLDGTIDLYWGAIRLDGGSVRAGPDGASLIIEDQPLNIAGAATLDAVDVAGAITLEAGASLTVRGASQFEQHFSDDAIQLDDSATLDIAGSLNLFESIAGYTGVVRLEDASTLSGGVVQSDSLVVAGNASLSNTTIDGYFTLDSDNGLSPTVSVTGLVQVGDAASAPDIDLGAGTVEVFGTLDLSQASYLTGGTIVVEAGGALILGGLTPDGTTIVTPYAADQTLIGQDVSITPDNSYKLAGATISILTGANSDSTPTGTPGTFVLDTAAAVEGYGRVTLSDASGAALALVNGSFSALGAGQTLAVDVADWIGTGTGTLEAQAGATLLFGTPGATAQGITSDTMLLLNVAAGAGATVAIGADAAPGTIDTRLTLDAGSSLLFDDGTSRTAIEDSLLQLGGDDPRPGYYTTQLGVLDLEGGRDFRAAHALDLTGFILLTGGTLSAPGITGHVAVIGGGAFGVLISSEIDGHGVVAADSSGVGFRATAGTLEVTGALSGGARLLADAGATLAIDGALPANSQLTIAAGGVISVAGVLGASERVGFTGPGTLELANPEGVSIAVTGTLEGAAIHLAGLAVAGGSHGVQVNRGTLGDVFITVTPADGGPLDSFDVTGDVDFTGVRLSSDGAGGSTLSFTPGANAAKPVVNPGTNEGMTGPHDFYFLNPVHVREDSSPDPYDTLQIFNQASGSPDQQLLDAYVISYSGYALANGGFTDLAPGANSNNLDSGQGTPIAVNLYTGYGGLITGTVTVGFRSHDDTAAIGGDLTDPTIGLGDQYIPSQTIHLAEQVFRYGQLTFPKVTLFARATTDTQYSTLHLDLKNSAPADGYSEEVAARLASSSGDFINATGSSGWINPGATDSSAISFQVDTNPADFASGRGTRQYGTFLFDVASSDAFGYSGLGTTNRPQQSVAVEVDFYRLAKASVQASQVYVVHPTNNGTDRYAAVIPVRNSATADGGSEGLVAAITGWGGDFSLTNPGTGEITPIIAAGATDNASLVYYIDTNPADFPGGRNDVQQGTAVLHFTSDGAGTSNLGTTDLGSQAVGITVYFYQLAHPTFQTHYSVHATAPGSGSDTTTLGFAVTNTVTAGVAGITDLLDSQVSLSSGDFTYGAHPEITQDPSGHATLIGEGQTNRSAITFQAVTNAALIASEGLTEQTGSFSVLSFSVPTDPGYDSYALGTQTVAVTVDVVGYAHPVIEGVDDGPTDPYTPFDAAGHTVTIDLGYVPEGFFGYHAFSLRNIAPNPTDDALYVGWNASYAAGTQYSPNLAPGAADDTNGFYYYAGGPGDHSEQITFTPFSINDTSTTAMSAVYAEYDWHVLAPVTIAWGWGDVHLATFAGTAYDFQAEGEFVLARAAPGGDGFEVQIRTQRYGASATVSVTREAAIRIGSQRLTIDATRAQPVWLDGAATAMSTANAVLTLAGGQVVQTGNSWRVTLASGEIVTVNANDSGANAYLNVGIQLAQGAAPGSVEGLLGPANGAANDFQLADGSVLAHAGGTGPALSQLYGAYAQSWRVTDATSLLDYGPGQATADFTDTRFPLSALNLASLPTALGDTATTAAANAGIADGALQQQAALDYALTGDTSFLSGAQNVQLQSAAPTLATIAADTPTLPAVVVLADSATITELAGGATSVGFSIGLTGTSDSITTIDWAVTAPDGSYLDAASFGGTLPGGTVDVLIGATTAHFSVLIPEGALGGLPTAGLQVSIAAEGANPVAGATAQTTLINATPAEGTPAQPDFAVIAGTPAPVAAGGTADLGRFVQGEAITAVQFQVSNLAAPGADDLSGTVSDTAAGGFALFLPGSGPLPAIAAGAYNQGVLLTASSTQLGRHSDTVTLAPSTQNASGYAAALDPLAITVTDSIIAAATPTLSSPATIDLGAIHIGGSSTQALSIANTAPTGAAALDVSAGVVTGALSLAGGPLSLDPGAADSTSLVVGLVSTTQGAVSGLVRLGYTSDAGGGHTLAAGTADLVVTGDVYALADPQITGLPDGAVVHVGDSLAGSFTVANGATADAYREGLRAAIAGFSGAITASGSSGLIAAGSADTGGFAYSIDTASAGLVTGALTLDLASDGAGTSGLGLTSLAPQTISLAVAVDNYATLAITKAGGDALLLGSGANLTLDFGTLLQGDPAATASLSIANAAAGLADLIDGGFTLQSGGGFSLTGFGDFSGLGAGAADTAPSVTLDTTGTGEISETLTLHAFASNAAGYDASLGEVTLTLHATVAANTTTACFATGTRIRTTRGDIPVESLTQGDIVLTATGRHAPISWIGRRTLHPARHRRPWDVAPIRIAAGAFAPFRPARDLLLSPDHALFSGGALIPARYLVNGATIRQETPPRITYWHVELDRHDILLAENLPAESYLDTGNRHSFEGQDEAGAPLALHPRFAPATPEQARAHWAENACAPLRTDGAALHAARRHLHREAAAQGWQLTADPALRLHADTTPLRFQSDGVMRYAILPPGAQRLVLASATSTPAETSTRPTAGQDTRRLGLALEALWLDGQPIPLDSPRLGPGWHPPEPGWRWTNGAATLDVHGALHVDLRLSPIGRQLRYWRQNQEDTSKQGSSFS